MADSDKYLREIWKIVLDSVRFDEQEATEKARAYVAQMRSKAGGHIDKESAEDLVRAAIASMRAALDKIRKDAEL